MIDVEKMARNVHRTTEKSISSCQYDLVLKAPTNDTLVHTTQETPRFRARNVDTTERPTILEERFDALVASRPDEEVVLRKNVDMIKWYH